MILGLSRIITSRYVLNRKDNVTLEDFEGYHFQHYIEVIKGKHFSSNFPGSLLIVNQMISINLTIFGIQVVNVENKLCLESTHPIQGIFSASAQYLYQFTYILVYFLF